MVNIPFTKTFYLALFIKVHICYVNPTSSLPLITGLKTMPYEFVCITVQDNYQLISISHSGTSKIKQCTAYVYKLTLKKAHFSQRISINLHTHRFYSNILEMYYKLFRIETNSTSKIKFFKDIWWKLYKTLNSKKYINV